MLSPMWKSSSCAFDVWLCFGVNDLDVFCDLFLCFAALIDLSFDSSVLAVFLELVEVLYECGF